MSYVWLYLRVNEKCCGWLALPLLLPPPPLLLLLPPPLLPPPPLLLPLLHPPPPHPPTTQKRSLAGHASSVTLTPILKPSDWLICSFAQQQRSNRRAAVHSPVGLPTGGGGGGDVVRKIPAFRVLPKVFPRNFLCDQGQTFAELPDG